jgi:formate hydrogenlyase subunit 3/multisubunit Na+/H+ antiporter MnhD subunit
VFGVVFAAVQSDMKRLLAWSSIENIGLIFAGIGLSILFAAYGMRPVAALALTAALYHVASHAFFKSLLFVGTGAVLHATSERSLGKLGGLLRVMPAPAARAHRDFLAPERPCRRQTLDKCAAPAKRRRRGPEEIP